MDITKLTPEQKAALLADLEADKAAQERKKQDDRDAYQALKDETIRAHFDELQKISNAMLSAKGSVFAGFEQLVGMKNDLYKTKLERQSDTFTTSDGAISIKIGNRVNEGWDETVEIGVQKVKDYLRTLAKDDDSADLVDTVMDLLAKDRKGNLRASNVLKLRKLATKKGNPDFMDGIDIIENAYRPVPTCQFVEVKYKDEKGRECSLPLSMSAIN